MKTVWVNGCFDLFHAGHVQFLNHANQLGDLTIGLADDETVLALKGLGHPHFPVDYRKYMLSQFTDRIEIYSKDFVPNLWRLRPDIILRGHDQSIDDLPDYLRGFVLRSTRMPNWSSEIAEAKRRLYSTGTSTSITS